MGLKILVVDDEFINRKLLSVVMKKYHNLDKVLEADNGQEAFKMLDKHPDIDFILLDIVMPKMNGVEFLIEKAKRPDLSHIPVIVLSTDDSRKREVINEGANDFQLKPIKEDILFELIDLYAEEDNNEN